MFENELSQIPRPRMHRARLDLLEVMCHENSELANQVTRQNGKSARFGLSQGDLSTKDGRQKLFTQMICERPQNIWYSPECFPWCLWNQYNESRSPELWERIFMKRQQSLWQISLGIVLYRFQVGNRSHFHHEQPSGSSMKKIPGMQEITNNTLCCRFDMCQVGALVDPQTGEPVRKRMEVHTTSEDLHRKLHSRLCPGTHQHRPIAGQTVVNDQRMPLSKFTEQYPIKFARQVARVLIHGSDNSVLVGEADDSEHPT